MLSSTLRRILGAAIAAGAGAAASWAVRRYLNGRSFPGQPEQDRKMLHTWENEGGNLAPAGALAPQRVPQVMRQGGAT
jgi:hypothetical protein